MLKKDEKIIFLIGMIIGATLFILIFGWNVLDFTYTDWLLPQTVTDLTQHYLGWVFYRDSSWHFPIGLIDNILYPDYASVVYTDSIPLFAFIFKLLSGILPEQFQYFGLFGILCYMLQGGFSACLIYHFTNKKMYSLLASVFFSGSLLMLFRMYYHTSLSAHWLIIASIYIWLCKESELSTFKSVIYWAILSTIAILTHAYLLPMVWGCMLCDILEQFLAYTYKKGFLMMLASGLCVVLFGWIFGMFYGSNSKTGALYGGIFSFNLNGFFNGQGFTYFFDPLPTASEWQLEGLAYLGLGIMILIAICLILLGIRSVKKITLKAKRLQAVPEEKKTELSHNSSDPEIKEVRFPDSSGAKKTARKKIKKLIPYIVFFAVFTMLAVSNVVTFGNHAFYIPLSDSVTNVLGVFRCSGRLIWPVYYMILLYTCIGIHNLIPKKWIPEILVIAALILQMIDISPQLNYSHTEFASSERMQYESLLVDPAWKECAEKYDHIMFYPNVLRIISGKKVAGYELQVYAHDNHMTLNMFCLARVSTEAVNQNVYLHFDQLKQGITDPDTMYVFLDDLPSESCGLHYYYLDTLIVGTPEPLESAKEIDIIYNN